MQKKVWIVIIAVAILALAGGAIAAQNILISDREPIAEPAAQAFEVFNGTGNLTGRIDNHSVEIEIDGELRVFGLSNELREAEFAPGPISFKYYVDKNGRSIITEAEFTKDEDGAVQTAEGVLNGQTDSHTVEIEIGGEARAFGLAEGISFTGINEGEQVFIAYREIGGRPVIIKVERLA
ncbi:MAG: hypothetical protein ACQESO_02100 [Bacillota bacterium]